MLFAPCTVGDFFDSRICERELVDDHPWPRRRQAAHPASPKIPLFGRFNTLFEMSVIRHLRRQTMRIVTMKPLPILWQRLVAEGKTCDRCSATYQEMQRAIEKLRQSLHPLGIEPRLEIREIDEPSFKANPSESNRIWIAGRPMEEWLGASVGSSRCCSVCGTSECRTVEVEGTTFETIPETLFLRAALVASSQLLSVDSDTQG